MSTARVAHIHRVYVPIGPGRRSKRGANDGIGSAHASAQAEKKEHARYEKQELVTAESREKPRGGVR